jgi:hypothetical protein
MYVWVNWLFYLLMAAAIFVFRRQNQQRAFSTWGYPYLPVIFVMFTIFYLGLTLIEDIRAYNAGEIPTIRSLMGVMLVLMGTPFYFLTMRPRKINR